MANGLFAGGDGTQSNPYLIEDANDLNAVRNNLSACYKLINNIDLNISPYNSGTGWIPIGTTSSISAGLTTRFTGVFDGNSKTINNLYINDTSRVYCGLFGVVSNSTLNNIHIRNANIVGASYVGCLAGAIDNTTITKCSTTGITKATTGDFGSGLVARTYNISTNAVIEIKNCWSSCVIGVGTNTTTRYTGGILGQIGSVNGLTKVTYCLFFGSNLYGSTTGKSAMLGSTTYYTEYGNNFFDKDVIGFTKTSDGSPAVATGLSTSDMKNPTTFSSWDTTIWRFSDGSYPMIKLIVLKLLIQDGNKWKYINGNNLNVAINDYTNSTDGDKYSAFVTYGMDSNLNKISTPMGQLENNNVTFIAYKFYY